jgi:hypothetical protein
MWMMYAGSIFTIPSKDIIRRDTHMATCILPDDCVGMVIGHVKITDVAAVFVVCRGWNRIARKAHPAHLRVHDDGWDCLYSTRYFTIVVYNNDRTRTNLLDAEYTKSMIDDTEWAWIGGFADPILLALHPQSCIRHKIRGSCGGELFVGSSTKVEHVTNLLTVNQLWIIVNTMAVESGKN